MIDLGEIGTATKLRYILRNMLKLLLAEIEDLKGSKFDNVRANIFVKLEKTLDLTCVTSQKTRVKERNSCRTFSDGVTELFTILSIANEMNK